MTMLQSLPPLVAASVCLVAAWSGETPRGDDDIAARVRALAVEAADEGDLDGLSLALTVGDEELVAAGWGWADAESREPAEADSAYRAGALTVPLVAVGLLALAAEDRVDLDRPVAELLDGLELENGPTLEQVLLHASGLTDERAWFRDLAPPGASEDELRAAFLAWLSGEPLESESGTCFEWRGTNVLLAGWVLEDVAESTVEEFLEHRVFRPLEMEGTLYCTEGPALRGQADALVEVGEEHEEAGRALELFSASRLCSTAPDLARLMRGLVDRSVIDEAGWRLLTGPAELAGGVESTFGMGLVQRPLSENQALAISGSHSGGSVHVAWYPAFDLVIAVAGSGEEAALDGVERRIARAFFEIPEPGLQDLALPPEERAAYRGGYYVGCTRISVEDDGEHLTATWPDGRHHVLFYQGYRLFKDGADPEIAFEFEADDDGTVLAFVLTDHGMRIVAQKWD